MGQKAQPGEWVGGGAGLVQWEGAPKAFPFMWCRSLWRRRIGATNGSGDKGGAASDCSMTLSSRMSPNPWVAAEGTEDFLFQPEGPLEARKVWRWQEPDFPGWRRCGCAAERLNVRIMGPLCDVEPLAMRPELVSGCMDIPTRSRTAWPQSTGWARRRCVAAMAGAGGPPHSCPP